ncbi:putative dehydrogenase [Entomoplasma freundtii]|uniref:Oxidoreductase n=1 Tax=Entomoplasma freundtii TaxID=74700 RepID=A0A2K8NRQ1_9MOLU|nr:Gfo/Idh/MocA family oxidoreductase [Entomoplasma freundtii]ATZ16216.1 oxidoreductase [Entomoplasma freundtii]TDY56883.1 putative dehydrogenase [Entomoplasma freundtii]
MRWGTIGTSKITEEFINGLRKISNQKITACYSRTKDTATAFIEKNALLTAVGFTNFDAMLSVVDVVYIASPNGLHFDQAKYFLNNHKHVLLEKPLTFTVSQAEELIKLANQNGVILMEAFKTTHLPQYHELKKWTENNHAFLSTLIMNQYSSRMPEVKMGLYRSVFDPLLGKGSTYDMLVYPVELAISLFGPVNRQLSMTWRLENNVGLTNMLLLEHHGGVFTNITTSKAARGVAPSEIIGQDGATATFSQLTRLQNMRFYELHNKSPLKEIKGSNENPFVYEINDFLALVANKDFNKMNDYLQITLQTIAVLEKVDHDK